MAKRAAGRPGEMPGGGGGAELASSSTARRIGKPWRDGEVAGEAEDEATELDSLIGGKPPRADLEAGSRRRAEAARAAPQKSSSCCRRIWRRLLALACLCFAGVLVLQIEATREHMWLVYVLPQWPWLWDRLHGHAKDKVGGVWHYREWVANNGIVPYLLAKLHDSGQNREQPYKSLADVACSVGFMLQRLHLSNPGASHYGSDISNVMLEHTRSRCPTCKLAQFDIGSWQREDPPEYAFPHQSFDYVVVGDVLFYVSWGGWRPLILLYCSFCRKFRSVIEAQERWVAHVRRLARRAVIFSHHERNPIAMDMFHHFKDMTHDDKFDVFVLPGTAGAA